MTLAQPEKGRPHAKRRQETRTILREKHTPDSFLGGNKTNFFSLSDRIIMHPLFFINIIKRIEKFA